MKRNQQARALGSDSAVRETETGAKVVSMPLVLRGQRQIEGQWYEVRGAYNLSGASAAAAAAAGGRCVGVGVGRHDEALGGRGHEEDTGLVAANEELAVVALERAPGRLRQVRARNRDPGKLLGDRVVSCVRLDVSAVCDRTTVGAITMVTVIPDKT